MTSPLLGRMRALRASSGDEQPLGADPMTRRKGGITG
jgi:hypothetical protein